MQLLEETFKLKRCRSRAAWSPIYVAAQHSMLPAHTPPQPAEPWSAAFKCHQWSSYFVQCPAGWTVNIYIERDLYNTIVWSYICFNSALTLHNALKSTADTMRAGAGGSPRGFTVTPPTATPGTAGGGQQQEVTRLEQHCQDILLRYTC